VDFNTPNGKTRRFQKVLKFYVQSGFPEGFKALSQDDAKNVELSIMKKAKKDAKTS